jgi:predicted transcriptional regulator
MAQVTTHIPDDLEQRVRAHLATHGGDLASFTARAFDELLSIDEDPLMHAELVSKTRQGLSDADGGRVREAKHAMQEIAAQKGVKFIR